MRAPIDQTKEYRPMPKGTHPTQIRLTEDDLEKLAVIRDWYGSPSLAQAIRHAISTEFNAIPEGERKAIKARLKKIQKKAE